MTVSVYDFLQQVAYRSNPNLRPAGTNIPYTHDQVDEYIKCKLDPIYFIRKYVKIVHVDRGLISFDLYPFQEKLVKTFHNNRLVISMQPRQFGKTQATAGYLLHYLLFNDQKFVAVLANKALIAREILARIQLAYENLPKWLQQGVVTWNKGSMELENGSRIVAASTSATAIRGLSVSLLYLDEFAFVENNSAEEFFTSVFPTISSGKKTKIIMSSTPNGYNHFYKFWNEAEKGRNGFTAFRVHWHEHPERDEKWYKEQKAVLGEVKFAQEVMCEFLGSALTLLNGSTLARLSFIQPLREFREIPGFRVYDDPILGHHYVMTVDVSRGRHLDYSAFTVWDITSQPYTQAATYYNNEIAPMLYPSIIDSVGRKYNEAFVLIEINDIGEQVANILYYDLEYENMFWSKGEILGKIGSNNPYPGIRTTKKTKRIGCANLKDMIDNNQMLIKDFTFISELATFVQSKTGSYEADEGFHDDLVTTGWLFAWMTGQTFFKDLTDSDIRVKMHTRNIQQMEDDLTPFGFIDTGRPDDVVMDPEHATAQERDLFIFDSRFAA